jgi:hypothetical protein
MDKRWIQSINIEAQSDQIARVRGMVCREYADDPGDFYVCQVMDEDGQGGQRFHKSPC